MDKTLKFSGRLAALTVMIALLGGCGTVISAAGTAVSTTFDVATDAVVTGAELMAMPFEGDDEAEEADIVE